MKNRFKILDTMEVLMKNFMKFSLAVLMIGLLLSGSSHAQFVKKAQVGFRFLENPVSAEVVGRGGVGVVNTFNANAVFWNPALTAFVDHNVDVSLNHTKGIADINYNAIGATVNLFDVGTLGFSLLAMDYGTFYTTVRAANEQGYVETGTFSPTAISFGTSFSQRINDRFSYGVQVKYVRQDLGDAWVSTSGDSLSDPNMKLEKRKYALDAVALDVGAYYDFLYNGIKFGVALQNISRELKYENEAFPLPFAISFGVTVEPLKFFMHEESQHAFILSFETRHPRDFGEKVKFGAEYKFMDLFTARVGYQNNYDERDWTVGVGIQHAVSEIPLRLDYAYQPFGIFGGVHYLSLGISY